MSTEPTGWTDPKTNYVKTDYFEETDINAINTNINAIENGERTLQPQQPTGNTGTLRQIFDWIAYQIGKIKGTDTWYDADNINLENQFWIDGVIKKGTPVNRYALVQYIIDKRFTELPPMKKLVLSREMYCADEVFNNVVGYSICPVGYVYGPLGSMFFVQVYECSPLPETLLSTHIITRPSGATDLYCGDNKMDLVLVTNNTENSKPLLIMLGVGYANIEHSLVFSIVPEGPFMQFKCKFSIIDV